MRTYIKIFGPPFVKAIKELEKIAVAMPQVSIMSTLIASEPGIFEEEHPGASGLPEAEDGVSSYFGVPVSVERREKLVSKYGELLGDHDFFFEWIRNPTMKDIDDLADKIDEALGPLGCKYTMTTRRV